MSKFFTTILMRWHENDNEREMPWKGEKDPYKIWLSEIILQQTKVEQGLAYYLKFIKNFPTVFDLAKAKETKVLKLWEGLGYYSRARNLHFSAKYIVHELGGIFPQTYKSLLELKGVGTYTAAAISSFAYKEKVAVVDGNVIRLLARYFWLSTPYDTSIGKKLFAEKANQLIDSKVPDQYNQAIMDFGATVCKPKNPLCLECPLNSNCKAYNKGLSSELPIKSNKTKVLKKYFFALHLENKNGIIIEQREGKGIWQNLFQLPLFTREKEEVNLEKLVKETCFNEFQLDKVKIESISEEFKQKLSHREIHVTFVKIALPKTLNIPKRYIYTRNLTKFAFPKVFILYLQSKRINLE